MEVGGGVGPDLSIFFKLSQNIPMLLIVWGSIPCVFCVNRRY